MADRALVEFVKAALERGIARPEIERALTSAGWQPDQARGALATFAEVGFPVPVPRPVPYVSAREAFLTIVMFIALGIAALNLGVLLFQFINLALPDPVTETWVREIVNDRMRWSVSALVVSFPLFAYLSVRMERERRANPALRASLVSKWLTYAALVIAAGVIMGDAMAAIYQFLAGELTLRFALKLLVIGLISGGTFLYYIGKVEDDGKASHGTGRG